VKRRAEGNRDPASLGELLLVLLISAAGDPREEWAQFRELV